MDAATADGVLYATGRDAQVEVANVTLHGAVRADAGASFSLSRARVVGFDGTAVLAEGPATRLALTDVEVSTGRATGAPASTGVRAVGAQVNLERVSVHDQGGRGVDGSAGARVEATDLAVVHAQGEGAQCEMRSMCVLRRAAISDVEYAGVVAGNAGADVSDSMVERVRPLSGFARGIFMAGTGRVTVRGATVRNVPGRALYADTRGGALEVNESTIAQIGTDPPEVANVGAAGVTAFNGAGVHIVATRISQVLGAGVACGPGSGCVVEDSCVQEVPGGSSPPTRITAGGYVTRLGNLEISRTIFEDIAGAGIVVEAEGALTLDDSVVRRTTAGLADASVPYLHRGEGIVVLVSGSATLHRTRLQENTGNGIIANSVGSQVALEDVSIRSLRAPRNLLPDALVGAIICGGTDAHFNAQRVSIFDVSSLAFAVSPGGHATLEEVTIEGVREDAPQLAAGVVASGAELVLRRASIRDAALFGIVGTTDATVVAEDVLVQEARPPRDSCCSVGVAALRGATLSLRRILVDRAVGNGLSVGRAGVAMLDNVTVHDTRVSPDGQGRGVEVESAGSLQGERVTVTNSTGIAVHATGLGTTAALQQLFVDRVFGAGDFSAGAALECANGARASVRDAWLANTHTLAVHANGGGARLLLEDAVIHTVVPSPLGLGAGVFDVDDARTTLTRVAVSRCGGVGVAAGRLFGGTPTVQADDLFVEDVEPQPVLLSVPRTDRERGIARTPASYGVYVGPGGEMDVQRALVTRCGWGLSRLGGDAFVRDMVVHRATEGVWASSGAGSLVGAPAGACGRETMRTEVAQNVALPGVLFDTSSERMPSRRP